MMHTMSALLVLSIAATGGLAQTTYYVDGSCGNDAWSGLSDVCEAPDGPKRTIGAGWIAAGREDILVVAPGVYTGPENIDLDNDIYDGLKTLRSSAGAFETIIDAQGKPGNVGWNANTPALIEGFTFTNFVSGVFSLSDANVRFDRCRFLNNSTSYLGGVFLLSHSLPEITNCEFIGNSAPEYGGCTYAYPSGGAFYTNCTFVGNAAPEGAISYGYAVVRNCIVRGPGGFFDFIEPTVTFSAIEGGFAGEGNIDGDPRFVDPAAGDYRLRPGSPCIDSGEVWALHYDRPLDLAGRARRFDDPATPDGGRGPRPIIDMGAHEYAGPDCWADCDGSGALDLFDFLCFVNSMNTATGPCKPEFVPLGRGVSVTSALAVFDEDGPGPGSPRLFWGGNRITRWDGERWSEFGGGIDNGGFQVKVYDLAVHDAGSGPALYAVGAFTRAGDGSAIRAARWNGTEWAGLGGGFASGYPRHIASFDEDGDGPAPARLFVTGDFKEADGKPLRAIARWDDQSWSSVGDDAGVTYASTMAVFDSDGSGSPVLYVYEELGGFTRVVRAWDGAAWTSMPWSLNGQIDAFCATTDGPDGRALYAGGSFTMIDGIVVNGIARWDGQAWHALGAGIDSMDYAHDLAALLVHDEDGDGPSPPALYAAGGFDSVSGVPAVGIARWDGAEWSPVGTGVDGRVDALAAFDPDGPGPNPSDLHVGGWFPTAGAICENIARWCCPPPWPEYADCTGDGALDLFDFLCFVNTFSAGC
jgi:hypothetical protein